MGGFLDALDRLDGMDVATVLPRRPSRRVPGRRRHLRSAASSARVRLQGQALLAASDHEGIDDVTEAYRAAGIWIEPLLESNRDKIA